MILAGAIGGTKTVLALCETGEGGVRMVRSQKFLAEETPSLDKALDLFLRQRDIEALYGACFGVAGPVADGVAKITNLGWTIDARVLSSRFGIEVSLLNDLQAIALGSTVVPPEKFAVLQGSALFERPSELALAVPARRVSRSMQAVTMPTNVPVIPPVAVMALGTGLGEATLVHDGTRYRALPSEGGHADFAASTDDEIELLKFLRARRGGHVSYERVLSGGGIGELYAFTRSRSSEKEPTWLAHDIAAGDPNAAIVAAALENKDACCARAIEMFAEILGAEAGNIALRAVAGSVVIGGGIPHKLLPALQSGGLIRRFNDKGRFSSWTSSIGVRILLEPRAALLGAALHAATSR